MRRQRRAAGGARGSMGSAYVDHIQYLTKVIGNRFPGIGEQVDQ
jgi:hypothetical protein